MDYYKFELYCGLNQLEECMAKDFLFKEAFINKLDITINYSVGFYKGRRENVYIVSYIGPLKNRPFIKEIAFNYKEKFAQECVLYCQTFIGRNNVEFI
jgi:hypothetical protein